MSTYEPPSGQPVPGPPAGVAGYPGSQYLSPTRQAQRPSGPKGLAILSLVLAIIGCCSGLLPLIMSYIALSKVRQGRAGGRGIARAAMVISLCWVVFTLVSTALVYKMAAFRDASGTYAEEGWAPAQELRAGDCISKPRNGSRLTFVKVGPCGRPHEAEIFARFPDGSADNIATLTTRGPVACAPFFKSYVGVGVARSQLELTVAHAFTGSFRGEVDLVCIVGTPSGETLTSLRRSRR